MPTDEDTRFTDDDDRCDPDELHKREPNIGTVVVGVVMAVLLGLSFQGYPITFAQLTIVILMMALLIVSRLTREF